MRKIIEDVYLVGSSGCEVYLVDTKRDDGLVLIDCGMDVSMIKGISDKGLDPMRIFHCILTHCHIDHIAACAELKDYNPNLKFYAHELDSKAIENKGHDHKTAASMYGTNYIPIKLERKFSKELEILNVGGLEFKCIHTPGHTPGSIAVSVELHEKTILFGQDIHGPFFESFGSDLNAYQNSMQKLLELEADILCEGHFGIYQPAEEVNKYIKDYMKQNRP